MMTLEAIDAALTVDNKTTEEKKYGLQQRVYETLDSMRDFTNKKNLASGCAAAARLDNEYGSEEGSTSTYTPVVDTEEEKDVAVVKSCVFSELSPPYSAEEAKWFKDLPAKLDETNSYRSNI